jgi:hypothetical protein
MTDRFAKRKRAQRGERMRRRGRRMTDRFAERKRAQRGERMRRRA